MTTLPSKELLSEVLEHGIRSFDKSCISPDKRCFFIQDDNPVSTNRYTINIYELAHKCKEWAYVEGFLLDSRVTNAGSCFLLSRPTIYEKEISKTFIRYTEPEAIFKACEWILEQLNKTKESKCGS